MASVDRNTVNNVALTTSLLVVPSGEELFYGETVFASDAIAELAFQFPVGSQHLDAIYGRAQNAGRGVVGEGGEVGPGVVGIAGGVIENPNQPGPRPIYKEPHVGRGLRVGVLGFGGNPDGRGEEKGGGDAVGVLGESEKNLGVLGRSFAHAGVYGMSRTTGVIGDGRRGQIGVEGFGSMYGVYGHVDYGNPNPDGIGVFGAAALDLGGGSPTGRAGVFVGPVEVNGDLTVLENFAVWGTKSAAVRHDDGKGRLLYCLESPECYIEDFGEAALVKGKASVKLDREFVGVAETGSYHVFLTPYGDSAGLFVSTRTRAGFEVREQGGGTSRLKFSYRVVARRKDVKVKRFQRISRPSVPKMPAALTTPDIVSQSAKVAGKRRPAGKQPQAMTPNRTNRRFKVSKVEICDETHQQYRDVVVGRVADTDGGDPAVEFGVQRRGDIDVSIGDCGGGVFVGGEVERTRPRSLTGCRHFWAANA